MSKSIFLLVGVMLLGSACSQRDGSYKMDFTVKLTAVAANEVLDEDTITGTVMNFEADGKSMGSRIANFNAETGETETGDFIYIKDPAPVDEEDDKWCTGKFVEVDEVREEICEWLVTISGDENADGTRDVVVQYNSKDAIDNDAACAKELRGKAKWDEDGKGMRFEAKGEENGDGNVCYVSAAGEKTTPRSRSKAKDVSDEETPLI